MARVELNGIGKRFGTSQVLSDMSLDIADGEFLTLVGPSGCGKSTLIRIIAGLEPQSAGEVRIGGVGIDHLRPHERRVAMVFQSYALYPHMSVFGNIALPLIMQRLSFWERLPLIGQLSLHRRREMPGIARDVRAVAAQLQIEALLDRRPAQLSGGQRQRVALGRAMVRQPDVFLMDEPLSNLDAKLRVHMRTELAELHQRLGATFIYVTHDQVEAMTMSDRVAMMEAGRILQLGAPSELYARPANVKVAQFIGSPAINLLPARIVEGGAVEMLGLRLPVATRLPPGTAATIGVRPEAIVPSREAPRGTREVALPAVLRRRENLGAEHILHFDVAGLGATPVTARVPAGHELGEGQTMLHVDAAAAHLFDAEGMRVDRIESDAERNGGSIRLLQGGRTAAP